MSNHFGPQQRCDHQHGRGAVLGLFQYSAVDGASCAELSNIRGLQGSLCGNWG